jgi:hypothetical protein
MANIINAITTGAGGLSTTADTSGNVNIQSNGSTVLALTSSGVSITGTLSATTISGAGGMTLLGTVNTTSGNSVSLGSLTLTNYKALFIVQNGVSITAAGNIYISGTNVQSGASFYNQDATAQSGNGWLDLGTGCLGYANSSVGAGGKATSMSTSTTTIYFRAQSTFTFTAGSFTVYGVA